MRCAQALLLELAADGAEMTKTKPHSTQFFIMRASAVSETFKNQARNMQVVMIVPGPKGPSKFAVFWHMILDLFAKYGPHGAIHAPRRRRAPPLHFRTRCGVLAYGPSRHRADADAHCLRLEPHPPPVLAAEAGLKVKRVNALATREQAADVDEVAVRPVLTAITADYIMRCHTTLWYSPGGQHSGGWCGCLVKQNKQYVGGYIKAAQQEGGGPRRYLEQPWLLERHDLRVAGPAGHARRRTCHPDLHLSEALLTEMGDKAAALTAASNMPVEADTHAERAPLLVHAGDAGHMLTSLFWEIATC